MTPPLLCGVRCAMHSERLLATGQQTPTFGGLVQRSGGVIPTASLGLFAVRNAQRMSADACRQTPTSGGVFKEVVG